MAELSAIDILVIGYYDDGNAHKFTAAELQAMRQWVANGGKALISCDASDYDEVCRAFGHPTGTAQSNPPMVVTNAALTHPIFSGPFGSLATYNVGGTYTVFTSNVGSDVFATQTGGPEAAMLQAREVGSTVARPRPIRESARTDLDVWAVAR